MYYFKTDNTLPDDARLIREMVFVKEQGFEDEFDDQDAAATHLVLYGDDGTPMGTGRFFKSGENVYTVGRIAVLKEYRKKHYGGIILQDAERQIRALGAKEIRLAAQVQAKGFYEKAGYSADGEEFLEEHCPHIRMCKKIEKTRS